MNPAPSLFISHGAPTFALEPGVLGPHLSEVGENLPEVKAVLVVSAHWQTPGVRVMTTRLPETLHDFRGFPAPLYELRYPAPGAPELAAEAIGLLAAAGFAVSGDDRRGLDHGVWVPLLYLLPKAQLPVFQVSMPQDLDPAGAHRLGQALAPLRKLGVLIVGSGSLTHNLYELQRTNAQDVPYAREFAAWIRDKVLRRDAASLVDYRHLAPQAERAHPTDEHFLPLLVALGASDASDVPHVIEGGMTFGVLSMDSYEWRPQ